jgi:flagellar basal-body rod protein FlgB
MRLDDTTLNSLATAIKFRKMRQNLISSNIANQETPGYKAKKLDFEDALARAIDIDDQQSLKSNDDRHFNVGGGGFSNLQPEVYEDSNGIVSEDGNTVDVEDEMSKLVENEILYNAAVKLMNKKLALMKYAVNSD